MRESRLFRIVYYLLQNGKATAPELAQKFEVSIRTIYRDIDAISSTGIPIYATQGKGGGIFILNDYTLDKSLLSEQEQEQMLTALQGMIATTEKNSNELLTKLSGLFQIKSTNWIEVDFSDWEHCIRQREISFEYLTEEKFYPLSTSDEFLKSPYEQYPVTICGQTIILTNGELAAALLSLPEKKREIIYLYFFGNYTQQEIADLYGHCKSTAWHYIHSALQMLQKEMEGFSHGEY